MQQRKCVNWDGIDSWARKKMVDLKPVLLKPDEDEESVLM